MRNKHTITILLLAFASGVHAQHGGQDHGRMDHATHSAASASSQRQQEVSRRGVGVMEFDLAQTVHIFTRSAVGGIQQVVARKPGDRTQETLVRRHLRKIRRQFLQGDFSGPSHIHGQEMPGLSTLTAAQPGQIDIAYRDVKGGAELRFSSSDPALVAALHQWFGAQLADHGKDAMAGHDGADSVSGGIRNARQP